MRSWYGKNDEHILAAIAAGDLTANPETGHVDYRGEPAGRARPDGYIQLSIRRMVGKPWVNVGAHRVVWIYCNSPIPAGMIVNHRNHRRWDNRLSNLDVVSQPDNNKHRDRIPYGGVGDHDDDNCVSLEWFAKVRELADSDNPTVEQISALMPISERMPDLYVGGARTWRQPVGRRGEHRRAG